MYATKVGFLTGQCTDLGNLMCYSPLNQMMNSVPSPGSSLSNILHAGIETLLSRNSTYVFTHFKY